MSGIFDPDLYDQDGNFVAPIGEDNIPVVDGEYDGEIDDSEEEGFLPGLMEAIRQFEDSTSGFYEPLSDEEGEEDVQNQLAADEYYGRELRFED